MNSNLRTKLIARLMKNAKGFTLIELLVVIVIVGVLSAVAVPTFLQQVRRSRVAEAQAGLDVVGTQSEIYLFDEGDYPNDWALISSAGGNAGKYMDAPWAQTAPHYGTPVFSNFTNGVGAANKSVRWTTTGGAAGTSVVEGSYSGLECSVSLGNLAPDAANDVSEGCNL